MIKLSSLNGWERLWLIVTGVILVGAIFYSLQFKDYIGQRPSTSCIAFTVLYPKEDFAAAKAQLQQDIQASEYIPQNILDRNGRLILEPTERVPTDAERVFGMREISGYFDYSCTTYGAVSKSIFFAFLVSLALFAGGHLFVWVKRGF